MKLPNADQAVVEREKIVGYLLNAAHRYGASKDDFSGISAFAGGMGTTGTSSTRARPDTESGEDA